MPADSETSAANHSQSTPLSGSRVALISAVVALSGLALLPVWASAWHMWMDDSLRSIGLFFPVISFAAVLMVWRRSGWKDRGTWAGLILAVGAMSIATLFSAESLLTFIFRHPVRVLHPGMASFLYGVGATLLFGGRPLLRRAIAPLCLLLIINPVPQSFQSLVDMPLQILSASTARAFAHLIGLQPTGEQLRMMFAPNFGMMIVPGCSGLRGAVTLGYLALFVGYIRRLRWAALALLSVGGVLLGYLLNLLRLCVLVVYYRVGLGLPSIQPYGKQVDYVIGVSLFFAATLVLGWVSGRSAPGALPPAPLTFLPSDQPLQTPPLPLRLVLLGAAGLAFFLPQVRSVIAHYRPPLTAQQVAGGFPETAGPYRLDALSEEYDSQHSLMFVWGSYINAETREKLALGIYLGSEDHLVSVSKRYQGIRPTWEGTLDSNSLHDTPARFVTSFYQQADLRTMDAETSCQASRCEQNRMASAGLTLVLPHPSNLLVEPADRRVPLVLRREWLSADAANQSDDELRASFDRSVRVFLHDLDLKLLLAPEQ